MNLRLMRNALSNLMGAVVPALAALGTVPLVVKGLGEAGYGLYSLVTAIVGYFAVIDINVTAGSVKFIAEHNARDQRDKINQTLFFGIIVYAMIGLLGGLGLFFGASYFVNDVFTVPPSLVPEAVATLQLAALGFFLGQLQTYLQSVPQALMRYDISSRIEMFFGTLVPLLTVGVLMLGYGLFEVILLRVVASSLHCLILWTGIRRLLPALAFRWADAQVRRELLGFSAYSFLSRFASLSYAHADKLIIGALVGVTGLAYFTVAATLANRILSLTYRLSGVLFPAASALAAGGEFERLNRLYLTANRYVVFLNAAILVLVAVFAEHILRYWMNPDFARNGALVLAVMAMSQFIDSLTSLPSLVNDGMGHPRVSGLFAVARACTGLVIVYVGVRLGGINGAAWAHLAASVIFTIAFLGFVHGRTVRTSLRDLLVHSYFPTLIGVSAIALAARLLDDRLAPTVSNFALLLMVSEDLPGAQIGGLGKHVVTLSNSLLAQGHQVDILGRNDRGPDAGAEQIGFKGRFIPGFDYARPGWKELQLGVFNPLKRPYFARKIASAINAHAAAYDVVHYHGHLPMTGVYLQPGINYVQTRHDQGSECLTHLRFRAGEVCTTVVPQDCSACISASAGPVRKAVTAIAVRGYRDSTADSFGRQKTIFVSEFLRRQFLRAVPGADLSQTRVIHNFIDYARLARHTRAAAGEVIRGQVMLIGRIDAGKGFAEFLAEAAPRLPPHAELLIVGDGPERAPLAAAYASARIRFVGWKDYDEAIALAVRSHVCVVPSVCEEACSTTVLEALALGKSCVALARGGTPELSGYQRYPGQLQLGATMRELVDKLLMQLAGAPLVLAPAPSFGADSLQVIPKLLDFYAE